MTDVTYRLRSRDPRTHVFEIALRIERPDPDGQLVSLPAWIPGSYLVRDFARHLKMGKARLADGRSSALQRVDKQTWRCPPAEGPLEIHYEVYARDDSVRAAFLDPSRSFVNASSVFLRVHGQSDAAIAVQVEPFDAEYAGRWQVATPMEPLNIDDNGWGQYRAENYEHLLDSPILANDFDTVSYTVRGVPHRLLLVGEQQADKARLAEDLTRICSAHADMMGALPLTEYSFIAFVTDQGYGGLEHRACSVLQVARASLPVEGEQPNESYRDFLGLCSHEYFHLWNVKRIRPAAVAESPLAAEAHFEDLWAYEGITSYYDELGLVRAGVINTQTYLDRLAEAATRMQRNPGRHWQSLTDSSFDAWTKFYKPDENTINSVVSYYNKGSFLALCLDLRLREAGDKPLSLDDLMRQLWAAYGDSESPVPEHGLEQRLLAQASPEFQRTLETFLARYLRGTDDMDVELQSALAAVGVTAALEQDSSDAGTLAWIGLRLAPGGQDVRLGAVLRDSPAEAAGLAPGDMLVAVAGQRVTAANLGTRLRAAADSESIAIHLFRGERLREFSLAPGAKLADKWRFTVDENAGSAAAQRRAAWLEPAA